MPPQLISGSARELSQSFIYISYAYYKPSYTPSLHYTILYEHLLGNLKEIDAHQASLLSVRAGDASGVLLAQEQRKHEAKRNPRRGLHEGSLS